MKMQSVQWSRFPHSVDVRFILPLFFLPLTSVFSSVSVSISPASRNISRNEEQWRVTGFNPDFTKPDPDDMTMICSVEFENEEIFKGFKQRDTSDKSQVIIDEDYQMAWIQW